MELILGRVIIAVCAVFFVPGLIFLAIIPAIQRSKLENIFADWYVTRELLLRCMPWVEPEELYPYEWLGELPKFEEWIGHDEVYELPETQGPRMVYKDGIGLTNVRQGWLPSGEEVAL